MKVYIITGTSRGIGEALAYKLINPQNIVFCISRKKNMNLIHYAESNRATLINYELDLSKPTEIESCMVEIFEQLPFNQIESLILINNAGTVKPVKRIEDCTSEEITNNIQVNLIAPSILTSSFIQNASTYPIEKQIVNISSGAGKKPYYGWSNYCASKAGLDLFTRSVAVEQENTEYLTKIISVAPGVVDTDMQAEIRASDKRDFKDIDRFIQLKEEGELRSAENVAEILVQITKDSSIDNGAVIDVRNYVK